MSKPRQVTVNLQRHRTLPNAGSKTQFVTVSYWGGPFHVLVFLKPGQFPEFEGENAWFVALEYPKKRFEFVRQVVSKSG